MLVAVLIAAQMTAAAPAPRHKIAVLGLSPLSTGAEIESRAAALSEVAVTEAARSGVFEVIGRSDIQALLGVERQRQMLGCTDKSACIAELTDALGSDYLLTGSMSVSAESTRFDLRIISNASGKPVKHVGRDVAHGSERALAHAVREAVRELLQAIAPAGVEMPEVPALQLGFGLRRVGYLVGGGGLLVGIAAAVLTVVTATNYSQLVAAGQAGRADEYAALQSRTRATGNAADLTMGLAIAALATGLGLIIFGGEPPVIALAPLANGAAISAGGEF
jgi:TolB-like protein